MKLRLIEAGALLLAAAVETVVGAAMPADVTSPYLGPTSSSTMSSAPASRSSSVTSGTSTSNSTSTLVTSGLSSPVAIPPPSTTTTSTSSPAIKSPTSQYTSGAAPTAPCGTISSIWVASAASAKAIVSGTPSPVPTVPATLAHECLNSIPLDKDGALALVNSLRPYLDWQSDLPWLKDPPAGYLFPPLDVMGYLDMIEANLKADKYVNEIEFETDLYQITAKMHSGHFGFYPDALTKVLSYARPLGLVTFGESTTTTPIIKLYEEVNANPATAQQISLINGQPANEYVEFWGNQATGSQDPDAGYNQMFFSRALVAAGSAEGLFKQGGRHKYFFPGAVTNFTYANGTTLSAPNYAYVLEDMTGVTDGASFYKKFCNPQAPGAGAGDDMAEKLVDQAADVVRLPGYPTPVLMSNDSSITAYYLDGDGYEDVAVIYANGFEPQLPPVFQKTVDTFIQMAKEDGKTKIIIDLQMNGGGYIFQGFDMFRQFFPTIREDGFNRWRESPQFVAGAQIISDAVAGLNPYTSDNPDLINMYESWWNFRYDLNTTNQHFTSYDAKFGPHFYKGDPYTAVMKWDFNDPLTTTNATFGMGMEITGYGSRANFTQPFPATHIIMLTDGYCASTCSLFQSAMKWQGGVRSVVFGGRPNGKPMNAVGGVKGSQVLGFYDIYNSTVGLVQENGNETRVSDVQAELINELTLLPINRSTSARINVRDSILRQNLGDGTPAQYIFEPADCRLYFTLDMHLDVSNMWKAAADAAWHGKPCVSGAGFTTVIDKRTDEERKELARRAAQRATVTVTVKDIPEEQAAFNWEKVRRKYNQKVRIM